jgi:hypothetical protein
LNGTLKFYSLEGKVLKQKELTKTMLSTEIKEIVLEGNELTVTENDSTDRFIIENASVAKNIFERIDELLKLRASSPAEQLAIDTFGQTTNETDRESTLNMNEEMNLIDSLFDVFLSLHGLANWSNVSKQVTSASENLKTLSDTRAFREIDLHPLSSAIEDHNAELVKIACFNILESICSKFKEKPLDEGSQQQPKADLKYEDILLLYFVLNDITLGSVVGDEKTDDEVKQFAGFLSELSMKTNLQFDVKDIINSVNAFIKESDRANLKELRATFRKQLDLINPRTQA